VRIAFVHGINNERNSADDIRQSWLEALQDGFRNAGLKRISDLNVTTAYYADVLAEMTAGSRDGVAMGDSMDDQSIAIEFLREYQAAAGIEDGELATEASAAGVSPDIVEAGPQDNRWVIALVRGLERLLPTRGKHLMKGFAAQGATYLGNRGATLRVDNLVRQQIFEQGYDGPLILIAHSLGTVVTYRILAGATSPRNSIPLYVTLGSPLTLASFRQRLPVRSAFPKPPIEHWLNGAHRDDFVTLGKTLGAKHIGFSGVECCHDIVNDTHDKHSIVHYLSSPSIARAIWATIAASAMH